MSVAQTIETEEKNPSAEAGQPDLMKADEIQELAWKAEGKDPAKQKRTPGLKFVDGAVYAGVTHFGVFAISVVFTFLTRHGNAIGGKFPNWMQSRNTRAVNFMVNKFGVKEQSAKDFSVVAWSFIDGCILLPAVRFLESQRTRIAYAVDKMLGKVPKTTLPDGTVVDDKSVYEGEPKQTWTSVIAGRVAAASMVVPIAMALDKWTPSKKQLKPVLKDGVQVMGDDGKPQMEPMNFNDLVIRKIGYGIADRIGAKPSGEWISNTANNFFAKRQERLPDKYDEKLKVHLKPKTPYKLNLKEFMEVNMFETVWTGICTAVLFVTSRGVAKFMGNRKEQKAEAAQPTSHNAESAKPAERAPHREHKPEEKASQHNAADTKSHAPSAPSEKIKLSAAEEKVWAEFTKRNPDLAQKVAPVATKLERVQQQRAEAEEFVGAARA